MRPPVSPATTSSILPALVCPFPRSFIWCCPVWILYFIGLNSERPKGHLLLDDSSGPSLSQVKREKEVLSTEPSTKLAIGMRRLPGGPTSRDKCLLYTHASVCLSLSLYIGVYTTSFLYTHRHRERERGREREYSVFWRGAFQAVFTRVSWPDLCICQAISGCHPRDSSGGATAPPG